MGVMASQIISLTIVYSTVYPGADQRKHQSSASLTFVRGIYRGPVNSPHKGPVTRKMVPFDDVIMGLFVVPQTARDLWLSITQGSIYESTCLSVRQVQCSIILQIPKCMMASWHGNPFCITGHCEESTDSKCIGVLFYVSEKNCWSKISCILSQTPWHSYITLYWLEQYIWNEWLGSHMAWYSARLCVTWYNKIYIYKRMYICCETHVV